MADVRRKIDVSVWSGRNETWQHFGVFTEREVALIKAQYPHWRLREAAIDVVDDGRAERIAEINRMLEDSKTRLLSSVDRLKIRAALIAQKRRLMEAAP